MPEEKSHEHHEHSHKKDEKIKFEISKVRIWQGISAILLIAVVVIWFYNGSGSAQGAAIQQPTLQQGNEQQLPTKQDIDLDDDPVLGDKNAPVTIVSFEDYQCPFCGRAFQQTFPLIKKDYIDTGKVKYVYRDFPLSFHPEAQPAAEAAECADEQGKYWEYHDGIFENQATMGRDLYLNLAKELNLDVNKFTQCIDTGKYRQEVQDDFAYGSQVGVSGTPTFFINGIQLVGAQPYQAFKQVIDAELANQ
ncbi:DsbA family protein [Candidatus Woesearchaeota archaeon]|nr:DsbA family protein [Candidatus Woesearchaeota archaeon]